MSTSRMMDVTCPKCHTVTPWKVWDRIDTNENPEMKEEVRNGKAFRFECPHCQAVSHLNYDFLYVEEPLVMGMSATEEDAPGLKGSQLEENGYTVRLVHSINAFMEKLLIHDAGLDDRIVEIMKTAIWARIENEYKDKNITDVLFAISQEGVPGFIFRSGSEMVASMEMDIPLYQAMMEAGKERIDELSKGIVEIDQTWAKDALEKLG